MGILDEARDRQQAVQSAHKPIDYDRMKRVHPKQKGALTRAVKTKDPEKIAAVVKAAVAEWDEIGAWPDDWNRWQIALNDALPWNRSVDIRYL
jgi:hypothetical protein